MVHYRQVSRGDFGQVADRRVFRQIHRYRRSELICLVKM
jgi:hypothetical protein